MSDDRPKKKRKLEHSQEDEENDIAEQYTQEEEEDIEDEEEFDEEIIEGVHDIKEQTGKENDKPLSERWYRPKLKKNIDETKDFVFQQIEADYTIGEQKEGYPGPKSGYVPIIRLYGITMEGHSVMCHLRGFTPYIYMPAPSNYDPKLIEVFRKYLNERMERECRVKKKPGMEYIVAIEIVEMESMMNYHFGKKQNFFKIYLGMPSFVKSLRGMIEKGVAVPPSTRQQTYITYESNILFVLRCMIDADIVGANWIQCKAGKYKVRKEEEKESHAQIEIDVSYEEIISHAPEGEWLKVAPMRILSFDIECAGKQGHFPQPEHDPVIQIANYVVVQGQEKPIIKNVFCLKKCSKIPGAEVFAFDSERDLLIAWRNFVIASDPDILTGYNIVNFDLPYLLNRAKALKIQTFGQLGRMKNLKAKMQNTRFSSRAYGTRDSKDVTIHGRVQLDVLQAIQRDYKLSSYSLNAVSAEFLGEQKENVHHSIITSLQNGDEESRRRLAIYCLRDAYLPLRLLDRLMIVYNYCEMARVTGIPLSFILKRGQQIKVLSQILRKCKQEKLLMPTPPHKNKEETYGGGQVFDPKRGFYQEPITTLDFASLYPSIMIAHNLCYTTLIHKNDYDKVKEGDYVESPVGARFVKSHVRRGILPEILENLLAARAIAKKDLKNETDPQRKAVLNGRQLALKISANSVYGFTGASIGQLPCLEISASVTAFGRDMILKTKDVIEKKYTVANGYEHDAVVIYGDTDSVMIKFGTNDLSKAMELGREAAEYVSQFFVKPVKLEFEKVYYPYLLITRKRYAGLKWTRLEQYDSLDAKGIESVRRDNCLLVRTVINTVLHLILVERSIEKAIQYTKDVIKDLLMNRLDISMLVITKSISRNVDDYTAKQAHTELAKRMAKRDPLTAPQIGDRVPYVIIKAEKGAKGYEKSEDPIWVLEHNIPIDTKYYLEHQLKKPLLRVFTSIMDNPESLFSGAHTRTISVPTPTHGGIMKFAKKRLTCLGCRALLKTGETAICEHCKPKEIEIYHQLLNQRNHFENLYSRVWTQCQRCQGSLCEEVLCTNRDCPVFYMRNKVRIELTDAQKKLDRFESVLDW